MLSDILSILILFLFVSLLLIGAVSTLARSLRYARRDMDQPVLLGRDRDLLIGLALPFGIIAMVRVFNLQGFVAPGGEPAVWYLLLTGVPPIYALAKYCYYELVIIEKNGDH